MVVPDSILLKAAATELAVPADRLRVASSSESDGSGKGQNFGCDLLAVKFRLAVDGKEEDEDRNYIVKCIPKDNQFREDFITEVGEGQKRRDGGLIGEMISSSVPYFIRLPKNN